MKTRLSDKCQDALDMAKRECKPRGTIYVESERTLNALKRRGLIQVLEVRKQDRDVSGAFPAVVRIKAKKGIR